MSHTPFDPLSPGPASLADRAAFALFTALLGPLLQVLAWATLWHPRLRRHVLGVPHPVPGHTWIHGASAGEHQAAQALARAVDGPVWRTSSSPRTQVIGAFPAPSPAPLTVGRWLDLARPSRLILVESDIWPTWIRACKRRGIPVALVQARVSTGLRRWRWLAPVWRGMMHQVVILRQEHFGDLKVAAPVVHASRRLPSGCVLAVSTRAGDADRVLGAWQRLDPRPPLVLAPRHQALVAPTERAVQAAGLSSVLWSAAGPVPSGSVLIIDTRGELPSLVGDAAAVVVGGTWDAALGGHSPAEATAAGLPVVAGPERHANPVAWQEARVVDAPTLVEALSLALSLPRAPPPPSTVPGRVAQSLPAPVLPAERSTRPWLWPLVPLVRSVGARRKAWSGPPQRVAVPVISVGGLTAGGSGKTPVAGFLAQNLPGAVVVARGHRRAWSGPRVRMGWPHTEPSFDLGDECELHRRWGVPVVSAPDRVEGARQAVENGAQVVILDDGFQHRRLARDLDIVCIDARWPAGGGPIPVGTAREPLAALHRADLIWLHNQGPVPPWVPSSLPLVRSRLVPVGWRLGARFAPLSAVSGVVDVAVGIARPAGLLCMLQRLGLEVRSVRDVGDHGHLGQLPPGTVVTEKDAARLPQGADVRVLVCRLDVDGIDLLQAVLASRGLPVVGSARDSERPCPPR